MPTIEELNALPYTGSSPFATGLTGGDYREQMRQHGQPFRWWKAWRASQGVTGPHGEVRERNQRLYIEQELESGVHCLFYQTQRNLLHPDLGMVPAGHSAVSVLPDECELAYLDRIAPVWVAWRERVYLKRGSGTVDALLHKTVASIDAVLVDGDYANNGDYALAENGGGIEWLNNAPTAGANYAVEYRYHPLFEFLGNEQGVMQIGKDGVLLPQRGLLRLVVPGGGETTF